MRTQFTQSWRFALPFRVLLLAALIGIPLAIPSSPVAAWPGCGIHVELVTSQPRVEISPSTPQIVAVARTTCATPRVLSLQLCLNPTIGDGTCVETTMTHRRGVLTARCLLSPAVGDRWTATAWVTDPALGTRQAEAVLIAEFSAGCVTREGVAAVS